MESKSLEPKLRFPEFRDAPGWVEEPFSHLYRFGPTNTFSRDQLNYTSGTVKNIHYGDIHTHFQTLFEIRREVVPFINPSELPNGPGLNTLCEEGDLIFADASEDETDVGKSIEIVELDGQPLVSGTHTILAKRIGFRLIVGFGGHLFRSPRIRARIRRESQGAKVLGLSSGRLATIPVFFPPDKTEQKKIAECLTSLDELIAAEGRKLEALRAHKKGLMQNLFPREGETTPRLRFPEFRNTTEWASQELGPLTTKVGSGITPLGGDKNYKPNGRPFLRSQNVGWGELLLNDVAHIDEDTHRTFSATEINKGDVLLNITGASIGRSAIADARIVGGNVNQHVCIIRLKADEMHPVLLNQFLISDRGQEQIGSYQAGGNRQGLNFAQIRSFEIPTPPTEEEQRRIADCLSTLDALIAAQAKRLDTLKLHKQGLMQSLFPSPEGSE